MITKYIAVEIPESLIEIREFMKLPLKSGVEYSRIRLRKLPNTTRKNRRAANASYGRVVILSSI